MPELVHHWYWARGAAGPYSVIASYITAEKRYVYDALPVFMLARDGKLIADDGNKVTFEELGRYTNSSTGKPVGDVTRYTYSDGEQRYVVTFTRHSDLARTSSSTTSTDPNRRRPSSSVLTAPICCSSESCESNNSRVSSWLTAMLTTRCGS